MAELKECPICNKLPKLIINKSNQGSYMIHRYYYQCNKCGYRTIDESSSYDGGKEDDLAIEYWNKIVKNVGLGDK